MLALLVFIAYLILCMNAFFNLLYQCKLDFIRTHEKRFFLYIISRRVAYFRNIVSVFSFLIFSTIQNQTLYTE